MKKSSLILSTFLLLCVISCAKVKPYEREHLSDPIMDSQGSFSKQTLEEKFFSTMEGSKGCESGIAGGCGCAK